MTNDPRVQRLEVLKKRLEQIPVTEWGRVEAWIAEAAPIIRSDWGDFLEEFRQAVVPPKPVRYGRAGGSPAADAENARTAATEYAANKRIAEDAKQRIVSTLSGILATAQSAPAPGGLDTVLFLCRRFPLFARSLQVRQRKRAPVLVGDEYDVQYLLGGLLRLHFDDVRAEPTGPNHAGGNPRMDFLLKREQTAVETKMTREGLRDREVAEELIIDIERYGQHPDCRTLVCYVYDPDHLLDNPRGLEADLSGEKGKLRVVVVVSP